MKRLLAASITVGVLLLIIQFSGRATPPSDPSGPLRVKVESRNPWTHLRFNTSARQFHFAIVSDRTGGHRAGIFSRAVEQLNLLQPEFVLSVGDLIEGYPPQKAHEQWREFQGYVCRLQMPFFYAPGNHDVIQKSTSDIWQEKFGRRYYHFVYKDVLFLILNPYDGSETEIEGKTYFRDKFSEAQLSYIKETLTENKSVRWTIVALHPPIWRQTNVAETGWLEVEKLLADRPYTVFCGHYHTYQKYVRQGRNYYQLATTGGASSLRGVEYGEFDEITWVTMKEEGPVLANLLLDGIYPEDMKKPVTDETGRMPGFDGVRRVPVKGKVLCQGCPVPGATVTFTKTDPATKRPTEFAWARVESDGSFRLYQPRGTEGAAPGNYQVTLTHIELNLDGTQGANRLPERYGKPETSRLRATVTADGPNEFVFELTN
jgi:hypothetical protein